MGLSSKARQLLTALLVLLCASAHAAITRTQAVSANATSVTLSSTNVGDLILLFSYRGNSATAPSAPAGYTLLTTSGGQVNSARLTYKFSTGGETSTAAATNATQTVALVYSGCDAAAPPVLNGALFRLAATSTTMQMTAFSSMTNPGNSWIAGFVGAGSATAGMNSNTANLTNRTSVTNAAGFDTGAPTTNITNQTFTITTTSNSASILVEVQPAPAVGQSATNGFF